jgi:pilus assembly protein CpaE
MYPLAIRTIGCQDQVRRDVLSLLANMHVSADKEYVSVDDAVADRETNPSGALYLISVPTTTALNELRRFTTSRPGRPVVALLAPNDPASLLTAMRFGAAQVVPLPIVPDDFMAALDCIARQHAPAVSAVSGGSSTLIVVSGSSGDSGSTALAVNLAHEMAHESRRTVILAEPTATVGSLASYVDAQPTYTTNDVYSGRERLDAELIRTALAPIGERLSLLSAEYRTLSPEPVPLDQAVAVIEMLRTLADVVILDVACTYDDLYFEALARADHVLLVGEQRIPSIRTLRLVSEALTSMEGVRGLHVVINRYDAKLPGFGAQRLKELLEVSHVHTVARDDEGFEAAVNHGRPLRLEAPRSPALADLRRLLRSVLPQEENRPATPKPGLFSRMIRAIGLER